MARRLDALVRTMFEANERAEAGRLVRVLGGRALLPPPPQTRERLLVAALRVSGGTLAGLHEALELAGADWRDLVATADFSPIESAYLAWRPLRFGAAERAEWKRGESLKGVAFAPRTRVRLLNGRGGTGRGTVIDLLAREPRARYLVRSDGGGTTRVWQDSLRRLRDRRP